MLTRSDSDPRALAPPKKSTAWLDDARRAVQQSGLLLTRPSLAGLEQASPGGRPGAVFMGVGLCSATQVSRALPFDLLGMLVPAELLRRAVGARALVVLVADRHALSNDLSNVEEFQLRARAREAREVIAGIGAALDMSSLQLLSGSDLHDSDDHRQVLASVRARATGGPHPYYVREVADVECLRRRYGGLVKVGWSVGAGGRRDEQSFDRCYRAWIGRAVPFVYCRAGRTLDDRRPKASPYVATDLEHRICLRPDEDPLAKIERARGRASDVTIRGVRKHLKLVARSCRQLVGQGGGGAVEQQVQHWIRQVLSSTPGQARRRCWA